MNTDRSIEDGILGSCCLQFFSNSPVYWWAEDWDSSEEAKDRTWATRRQLYYFFLEDWEIKSNRLSICFLFFN